MGFHLTITQRNYVQQSLRLRAVIGIIIFARKHHQTHVLWKSSQLLGVKGQLIPALLRRLKIIVEKGVTIAVVRARPGEENALFIRPRVNVVALMTILELARNPHPLQLEPFRRQCKLQQVIHRREIGREHFPGQLHSPIRIKIMRATVFRNLSR